MGIHSIRTNGQENVAASRFEAVPRRLVGHQKMDKVIVVITVALALSSLRSVGAPAPRQNDVSKQIAVPAMLSNKDVLSMIKAGLSSAVVIAKIESSACDFDTSPTTLGDLKKAGVPDGVILAMVKAPAPHANSTASEPASKPLAADSAMPKPRLPGAPNGQASSSSVGGAANAPSASAEGTQAVDVTASFKKFVSDYIGSYKTDRREEVVQTSGGWSRKYFEIGAAYMIDVRKTDSLVSPYLATVEFPLTMRNTPFHKSQAEAEADHNFVQSMALKHRHTYAYQDGMWVLKTREEYDAINKMWWDCDRSGCIGVGAK